MRVTHRLRASVLVSMWFFLVLLLPTVPSPLPVPKGFPSSHSIVLCIFPLLCVAWARVFCSSGSSCEDISGEGIPIVMGYDSSLHEYEIQAGKKVSSLLIGLEDKVRRIPFLRLSQPPQLTRPPSPQMFKDGGIDGTMSLSEPQSPMARCRKKCPQTHSSVYPFWVGSACCHSSLKHLIKLNVIY